MKQSMARCAGQVGVLFGLCVACSGKVHELSNSGGAGGATHDSTTNVAASGGQTRTTDVDQGGSTSTLTLAGPTGGNYPDTSPGTGGTHPSTSPGTGGTYPSTSPGAGGTSADTVWYSTELPRDILPKGAIDGTCQCTNVTEVCNAEKACVPRCIADGTCAEWLTNRAVRSMYHDGTALYYATARSTDVLGNPGPSDGSLYSVAEGTSTPIEVTATMLDPEKILGRYKGATYLCVFDGVKTYSLIEVTDAGLVTKLADSDTSTMDLSGRWLVYVEAGGRRLFGYDLDQGMTSSVVLDATSAADGISDVIVVGDNVVCRMGTTDACSVSLTTPESVPTCGIKVFADGSREFLAANENQVFFGGGEHGQVRSYDHVGTVLLTLFTDSGYPKTDTTVLVGDWLYSGTALNEDYECAVLRYPTKVGRLPQTVLPYGVGCPIFAVGRAATYWSNRLKKANSRQYVFRMPLPEQPCDAELPCITATQQCIGGTCRN